MWQLVVRCVFFTSGVVFWYYFILFFRTLFFSSNWCPVLSVTKLENSLKYLGWSWWALLFIAIVICHATMKRKLQCWKLTMALAESRQYFFRKFLCTKFGFKTYLKISLMTASGSTSLSTRIFSWFALGDWDTIGTRRSHQSTSYTQGQGLRSHLRMLTFLRTTCGSGIFFL